MLAEDTAKKLNIKLITHEIPINEQKDKWLPPLISGKEKTCFGVTEPDAGLDTGKLKTFAKKIVCGKLLFC